MRGVLLLLALLAGVVAATADAAPGPITIAADERMGSFRVKADGTLGGATRAFGRATRIAPTSNSSCTATWRPLSLTILFYNLGGDDPCSARGGKFGRAVMRGPTWRTTKGLRNGDPVSRLRSLYPRARFQRGLRHFWPAGWWITPRANRFGLGGSYPGLLAETRGGRVVAFHVRYQAGGE